MLSESQFFKFAEAFSKHVHQTYFSEIRSSDWIFERNYKRNCYFGFHPRKRFFEMQKHLISFHLNYDEGFIALRVVRFKNEDKQHYQNITKDLTCALEKSGMNALMINNNLYSDFDPTSSLPIFAFGEKAKEVLKLIEIFSKDEQFTLTNYGVLYLQSKSHTDRKSFFIIPKFEERPYLELSINRSTKQPAITKLFSAEDITSFSDKLAEKSAIIHEKVGHIVNKVKEIDVTCYYNEKNRSLFIYNERVPFYISSIREKNTDKFRVRFLNKYIKGTDLNELISKVETKAMSYVKSNRIKAAVSGGASDTLSKFLFRTIEYQGNKFYFNKLFHSTLSEGDLNKKLLTIINEPIEPIDKNRCSYYQMYLRSKGDRHQIKTGKKLNDLYTFISASKLYVLTEAEFDAIQLDEHMFKQKKDKLLVHKLNEQKIKVTV